MNSKINIVIVFLLSVFILSFFYNKGFVYYDEGYILHGARRILDGEIPYRDFQFIYTPGILFVLSAFFKILGVSILVGRIAVVFFSALTSITIFFITKRITSSKIVPYLSVLIYLFWGPAVINFPWPVHFAYLTGLLTIFSLLKGIEKKKRTLLLLSGTLTLVTFVFKQNFGAATLLASLVSLFITREKQRLTNTVGFFSGLTIGIFILGLYFLLTGSLTPFLQDFYFFSVEHVLLKGSYSTSFPGTEAFTLINTGKIFLYLFPAILSLLAIVVSLYPPLAGLQPIGLQKQLRGVHPEGFTLKGITRANSFASGIKHSIFGASFAFFTLFFYLAGIRPTTDFVHLAPLMATIGIPLSVLSLRIKRFSLRVGLYGLIGILLILGPYSVIWKSYYRWEMPFIKNTYKLKSPAAKIYVDEKYNLIVPGILKEIEKRVGKDESLFAYYNGPMFYFLSGRKNPTRFINFPKEIVTEKVVEEVVVSLEKNNVPVIIVNDFFWTKEEISLRRYVFKNYQILKSFYEFTIFVKKR